MKTSVSDTTPVQEINGKDLLTKLKKWEKKYDRQIVRMCRSGNRQSDHSPLSLPDTLHCRQGGIWYQNSPAFKNSSKNGENVDVLHLHVLLLSWHFKMAVLLSLKFFAFRIHKHYKKCSHLDHLWSKLWWCLNKHITKNQVQIPKGPHSL